MTQLSRRDFQQQTLASLLTFSLLETLFQYEAFGSEVQPIAARWLAELNQLGLDVKGQKLTAPQWQEKVEELFRRVEVPELLKFIDFAKLTQNLKHSTQGEVSLRPQFPQVEGLPTELVFGSQIFALQQGRSVVPHGHDNMATAFLILKGAFEGRHYDRIEDTKTHMIIQPTIDRKFTVGDCSTVSDVKDNVHWFKATSDEAFIFNIHVMSVRPGRTGRVYIDPAGEKLAGGRIRARKLKTDEAYRLYG